MCGPIQVQLFPTVPQRADATLTSHFTHVLLHKSMDDPLFPVSALSVIMGNTALDHEDLYYLGVGNGLLNRKRKSPEMGININPSITQVSMQVVTRVANMSCLYFHWDRLRCLGPVAFSVSFNPTILRPRSFHCNDNLRSSRRRRHIVQSQSTARTVWSL